eukprot:jgi/Chrzof1/4825/Cz15g00220.t1
MSVVVSWDNAFAACASRQFADLLAAGSPYESIDTALAAARDVWWNAVSTEGWLQAFAAHPKIGDVHTLKAKYSGHTFGQLSQSEQSAALQSGNDMVFEGLAVMNAKYETKFGHIFIICATGKSASEMLSSIHQRFINSPYQELGNAAREQMKITELRLINLLSHQPQTSTTDRAWERTGQILNHLAPELTHPANLRSPITTHVLDTALGVPAQGLPISLHRLMPCSQGIWDCLAMGVTDSDGRIPKLLPPSNHVAPGTYQMRFDTGSYLKACRERHPSVFSAVPFYPAAVVEFTITQDIADQHFHIPLLLNPFGYSTYKGS